MNRINVKVLWFTREFLLGLLLMFFLLSLLFFFINGDRKRRVILFFPEDNLQDISGDFHIIPLKNNDRENMKLLLAEALLQPLDFRLNQTVPEGVKINSFIYDSEKKIAFVDLSIEMIQVYGITPGSLDSALMLKILEKNLIFSHPNIKSVKFSIDGQIPFSPVFVPQEE